MKLLTTRMSKDKEDYILSLERMADAAEAARDACAAELRVLTKDAAALRGAITILVKLNDPSVCDQCSEPLSVDSASTACGSCEAIKTRARLRIVA